jgi:hypothetical protein
MKKKMEPSLLVETMASNPLEVLRKGLEVLTNRIKPRKNALQAQLAKAKSISSEDEQWLDYKANLVDEQCVLEALEDAPDYETGEAILASFGRQTRLKQSQTLTTTQITDYFHRI